MTTIRKYLPEDKATLVEIFKSNMPLYFADEELPLFEAFLDKDTTSVDRPYWVVFKGNSIVGCGGIGINKATKYTNEPHVIMCWGMIKRNKHKLGFGKVLLNFRIEQSKILFPEIKIALGTSQYTFNFFEKFGFKTVCYEKDHWGKDLDLYQMELVSL